MVFFLLPFLNQFPCNYSVNVFFLLFSWSSYFHTFCSSDHLIYFHLEVPGHSCCSGPPPFSLLVTWFLLFLCLSPHSTFFPSYFLFILLLLTILWLAFSFLSFSFIHSFSFSVQFLLYELFFPLPSFISLNFFAYIPSFFFSCNLLIIFFLYTFIVTVIYHFLFLYTFRVSILSWLTFLLYLPLLLFICYFIFSYFASYFYFTFSLFCPLRFLSILWKWLFSHFHSIFHFLRVSLFWTIIRNYPPPNTIT